MSESLPTSSGLWKPVGEFPSPPSSEFFEEAMTAARKVRENAYAPYSGFFVGAAALMDGRLFAGCNVENASYGATICAERAAIFRGVSENARRIDLLALTTSAEPGAPLENRSPCGMCRQVIAEFAHPGTVILLDAGSSEEHRFLGEVISFDTLLPLRFRFGNS